MLLVYKVKMLGMVSSSVAGRVRVGVYIYLPLEVQKPFKKSVFTKDYFLSRELTSSKIGGYLLEKTNFDFQGILGGGNLNILYFHRDPWGR